MSAISWELSLATFIPLQLRRKGRCVRLSGDKKWSGQWVVTECVCLCVSWGEGVQGAAHWRRFFFFFLLLLCCRVSSWSLWLSDSGAQWHFLIGFPSHPLVASALAQQSQGHNHSCAGLPKDTTRTAHAYKLYAHYLVSLQLLISNYYSNLALTEPRGTHTDLCSSQLCALLV